jgi:hypothetical protein
MRLATKRHIGFKLALALPAFFIFLSCAQIEPYMALFQNWDYSFSDGGIQFASLKDVSTWVSRSIVYRSDPLAWGYTEYWAAPAQTLAAKQGDCEDYALLFMYFAYSRHLAAAPELVGVMQPDGIGHALVRIDDTYYDPTSGTTTSAAAMNDSVMYTLSYGQAIYIAVTDHGAYKGIARAGSLGSP